MPSISTLKAFNLQTWIEQNKDKLKPPVGNAQVWEDGEIWSPSSAGPTSGATTTTIPPKNSSIN